MRGVKASVKAQILVVLQAKYSQQFIEGRRILPPPPLPPPPPPPPPPMLMPTPTRLATPRSMDRLIVVLDMDECLVHSVWDTSGVESGEAASSMLRTFSFQTRGDEQRRLTVNMRPGLERFLRAVCADTSLEVHIFTAGEEQYAAPLLDTLQGLLHISLPRRHYRSACTVRNQYYMKNLAAITTRADDLARVVLVDNLSVSFALQPDNGIPIADFIDDPRDSELARVLALLNELASEADVRPVLARRFGLADSETMRSLRQRIDGGDPNPRETLGRGSRL